VLSELFEWLLVLPGWFPGSLVFLLPALEAPAFLGLVLPGELALILGGVLAQQGRLSLPGALALGVAGAVAGDAAGWWLGRRWGGRLRRTAGLPLGAFLARTAPAAAVWAATHVLFGYAAGSGFQRAQAAAGRGGWLLLGIVVVVLAAGLALRAARRHRAAARVTADPAAPASCAGTPPR
jgi:membrane protein DedA with SNARE-associated domain